MLRKKPKNELWEALLELRGAFAYAAFFSLFINLLMLTPSLYMLQVYDRVLQSRSVMTLLMLSLIVAILFATMSLLEFARSRLLVRAGNKLDSRLNNRLFDAMFRLSLRAPGQTSAQAMEDLTNLRQFLTGAPLFAFFDAPWVPIYLFVLFLFHPIFGWFAIGAAVILSALAVLNEWLTRAGLAAANAEAIRSRETMMMNLRNAEVVHAMGMLESLRTRWLEKYYSFLRHQSDTSDQAGVLGNTSKALRMLFQSLVLGLGGYLAIQMEVTPGMMIAGSIIMGRALAPIDQLIASWKQFSIARLAYGRLRHLLTEIPAEGRAMSLPTPQGRLTVEGLVVVPPGAQAPVLRGIAFALEAGETLAVVGPSAAGKSTLARAILGIWSVVGGKVRLDGADIAQWNRDELGPYIGYLPQDIELFSGTIADNICRFGPQDPAKVVAAAQLAGVHEMILRLPQGYDTPIGGGGGVLSGGQRQRIGLARAVYGAPRFIVLDEPNSNLDDQGDLALLSALDTLKREIRATTLIISHRLNVLAKADKLLVLQEGQLQLFGPRDEVLARLMPQAQQIAPAGAPGTRLTTVPSPQHPPAPGAAPTKEQPA